MATETALFVVMTKFDMQFEEKAGEGLPSQRFTTRINVNLTEFFGRTHGWPHEWHPGKPFTNCFWMRNPNFRAKQLLRYNEQGEELGLLESEIGRIAEFKQAYLENALVRQHFRDPERAWDEAFKLNDGGIEYLAENLVPVCNPDIKRKQVRARYAEQRDLALESLSRFHVSDDKEEERAKRRAQAIDTLKQLDACVRENKFGQLLEQLGVSEQALADLYFRIANDTNDDDSPSPVADRADGLPDLLLEVLGSDEDAGPRDDSVAEVRDRAAVYADQVVATWIEDMRTVAENNAYAQHLQIAGPALGHLVSELAEGERRQDVRRRIAERVRDMNDYRQTPKQAKSKSAMVAAVELNNFVNRLGFDTIRLEDRPTVGRTQDNRRPIFAQRPEVNDIPSLGEVASYADKTHAVDWMAGFIQLVDDNAGDHGGQQHNSKENIALGNLIARIDAADPRG